MRCHKAKTALTALHVSLAAPRAREHFSATRAGPVLYRTGALPDPITLTMLFTKSLGLENFVTLVTSLVLHSLSDAEHGLCPMRTPADICDI